MGDDTAPSKEKLQRFCDDRGNFTNLPAPFPVKRAYVIENSQKGVIRAFHGHRKEDKAFYVVKGAFIFNFFPMDGEGGVITMALDEKTPEYITCPRNWYNGFVSLKDDSRLVVLSSSTMEESKNDDFRLEPLAKGDGIWKVKNR